MTRRSFLSASSLLLAPAIARLPAVASAEVRADVMRNDIQAHEPELVQEVVLVAPLTAEEAKSERVPA